MKRLRINHGIIASSVLFLVFSAISSGQSEKAVIDKYLKSMPAVKNKPHHPLQRYRMTAVYINRDLYGNFMSKTKVTGDYTEGLHGDSATWNNVYISSSDSFDQPFPQGSNQEYMENFKYFLSKEMFREEAFKKFPSSTENVFARNLIWDMMALKLFGKEYHDSLKLNIPFIIPDKKGGFKMSDIGNYSHNKIELCWKGITQFDNELCSVLDFTAIDNKIELNMEQIKTRGTEQYWGTVLVSINTGTIMHSVMNSGTIQEIEVKGLKDKFLTKTVRELEINMIK